MTGRLHAEYEALLHRNGMSAPPPGDPYSAVLTEIGGDIQRTLTATGIDLPCPVYVAPCPRQSFDAQARMFDGGALILVNAGFLLLVSEIMKVKSRSVQVATFNDDSTVDRHVPTEEFRRKEAASYRALAAALLTYIDSGEPWRADPQVLDEDWRFTMAGHEVLAVLRFVVAHEFGHVLAGHLSARPESWTPRSWDQELEADQLGALILLNHMDERDRWPENFFVASGPFLFFAVDHLIGRVRNEMIGIPHGLVAESHPPSDERAAALRDMFVAAHGPRVMHAADAGVQWMSWREEPILAEADRQLHRGSPGSPGPSRDAR